MPLIDGEEAGSEPIPFHSERRARTKAKIHTSASHPSQRSIAPEDACGLTEAEMLYSDDCVSPGLDPAAASKREAWAASSKE